jgi:putative ABC transport system permease protein
VVALLALRKPRHPPELEAMTYLPLANLLHHKLRSILTAAGIGVGICMLLTLSGLTRGSLNEVADRWDAVDADLIVYPPHVGEKLTTLSPGVSDGYADKILAEDGNIVRGVVPVFLWPINLAGQDQLAVGVDPDQWQTLTGGRGISQGRLFDPNGQFTRWLTTKLLVPSDEDSNVTPKMLAEHGGLELVIDSRLAAKGHYNIDDEVQASGVAWRIVGIVPQGGMSRVYMPRRAAQNLFGNGTITKSTLMFIKLKTGVNIDAAARQIRAIGQEVVPLHEYRQMLQQQWGTMYKYVDIVNAVALINAFLFIMVTLYTMVLQRTREIAILKSFGATGWYIIRGVLAESMIITAAGGIAGLGLSFLAGWLTAALTLYTVTITWVWILIAVAAAVVGATLSAIYPAWRATRVDMVQSLTLE